ncbi:MAG: response regulator [Vicinamibacterales bacterium]
MTATRPSPSGGGFAVLVADDHGIVRHGVLRLLAEHLALGATGEAGSFRELRVLAESRHWDVLILDLSMPDGDGIEQLRLLHAQQPRLPIVVFTMFPEEQFAVATLGAGASGFVAKHQPSTALVEAVRHALKGERYVSSRVADRLVQTLSRPRPAGGLLSPREREVLRLLGSGARTSEIASRLGVSAKTVSTYKARIQEKLELRNTAELVRYAVTNGLFERS